MNRIKQTQPSSQEALAPLNLSGRASAVRVGLPAASIPLAGPRGPARFFIFHVNKGGWIRCKT